VALGLMSATGVARSAERLVIAVDGPSASGKGTLAKRLAAHFRLPHLDTGLLYRAVGWRALQTGQPPAEVAAQLTATDLADPALRSDDAGQQASKVGAIPEVRANLLKFQKEFSSQAPGAVLDGRDIGTVICPNAEVKIFVTASPEVRAGRRASELRARGEKADEKAILSDIIARDARDRSRATAPLMQAPDAHLLDTSTLDIDGAFRAALALVEQARRQLP